MQAQAATPCFVRKEAFGHPPGVTSVDGWMDGWMDRMDHVTHVTVHGVPEYQDTSGVNMQLPSRRAQEVA